MASSAQATSAVTATRCNTYHQYDRECHHINASTHVQHHAADKPVDYACSHYYAWADKQIPDVLVARYLEPTQGGAGTRDPWRQKHRRYGSTSISTDVV